MEERIAKTIVSGFSEKLRSSLDVDAALVGAGPSGLICGAELARDGYRVAIFERKLAPGGGVWGGAMLQNEIVFQPELAGLLDEYGIRVNRTADGLLRADSVETAAALIYRATHAGARVFNAVTVEDVVFKDNAVRGVVINWTPVLARGLHVDPLMVLARATLDATGHDAALTARAAAKAGVRLQTPSGGLMGEKPMWAEAGEVATVENTREVYPGLFVSGMAANAVFGAPRMGPIFGGMFRSGQRAAKLIRARLENARGSD